MSADSCIDTGRFGVFDNSGKPYPIETTESYTDKNLEALVGKASIYC